MILDLKQLLYTSVREEIVFSLASVCSPGGGGGGGVSIPGYISLRGGGGGYTGSEY